MAEGTRLLSEYGGESPSRVRIPPSPFRRGAMRVEVLVPAQGPVSAVPSEAIMGLAIQSLLYYDL